MMTEKELRDAGEMLAKACAVYHKAVAENSNCKSDELVSEIKINNGEYLYKILITAEPLDD